MAKEGFREVVGTLFEYKSTAENAAGELKRRYPKKASKEYKTAEQYYNDAKISFDTVLAQARASLLEGNKIEISEKDDVQVNDDIRKLVKYSDSRRTTRGVPVELILTSLITIFGAIWKYYKEWNDKKITMLLAELETYRWKSFDEI